MQNSHSPELLFEDIFKRKQLFFFYHDQKILRTHKQGESPIVVQVVIKTWFLQLFIINEFMERNWKGKLCWSILQLKYGCLHILTVHNIKEKMEEAFVKFVLFVQDDNGKGNFIRKQRKRGGVVLHLSVSVQGPGCFHYCGIQGKNASLRSNFQRPSN